MNVDVKNIFGLRHLKYLVQCFGGLTLCLHAGSDQSQRVTGELTAGAGHGAAGQQDDHAGVGAVGAVLLQVAVLQRLQERKVQDEDNSLNCICVT